MTDFFSSAPAGFPRAPGAASDKIRRYDWARHPLGPVQGWPRALLFAVEMVLASDFPKCLMWGEHRYCFHNDAFRTILGDKPDALGRPVQEVWSEVWDVISPIVDKAFRGESTFVEDFPLTINRHGYDEEAYFTFCYSPVRDDTGVVVAMMDTVIETTGKVIAERGLREAAASLEQQVAERTADRNRLWLGSDALLMVTRFDGQIVAVNPAWTSVLGWTEQETVGRQVQAFAHPDDEPTLMGELNSLQKGAPKRQGTLRYRHRDGTDRWVAWTAAPADGFIQAVGRDVTEERAQAEALRSAEEQLRQSQKMEALGQLTGGIAHDLNNMLQGIVLPLQLIRQRIAQGREAEAGKYIDAGLAAAKRAGALTQRLLAFSRRQPLDSRPVDLAASLASLETIVRSTCGENIALQMALQPDLWPAYTDVHQFDNAVLNLCINARDAMPERGTLRIEADNVNLEASGDNSVPGLDAGEYVRVTVSDTGVGMSADVMARAFDPFFTTKPLGQGTGLGLSMIYGFMRQSGGLAVLESTVGQGTRVSLYFCRSRAEAAAERADPAPMLTSPRRPDSALVVEDDDTVRVLAVELLRDNGFYVMEAASGSAAMALLSGAVHFDLLVSDVGLPGPNGRQVADYAREKLPAIKIILMTGYAEQAAMNPQFLGAQMELLVKPFDAQALVNKVLSVMGGGG
ncbi:PAS domain-containing sensor histidine kinase [Acidovorax sp. sic0104]|uniref:hybrid sensor histidine kinase/response regulator n=1 Tax=Acidovorax sp. sic0104 TaxID=2854784 RepID=UPI001C46DBEF|nr:PAS domain-containing sensor histidine kinase [Acidovorax sp. sic0104]MBV7540825.1 PAS domain S-box protein [Acidovorax sp. sic0104]